MTKIERGLLDKLVSMNGERAKVDAKTFGSYVVYRDQLGRIVREYPDGKVEIHTEENL